MLRESQPQITWEVHNAAMTAINSHVTLPIARDCARLAPDVFIVLAGNNEAVGPYGPGTVFGQSGLPLSLARASTYVGSTRLGQLFTRVIQSDRMTEWRGMEMFTEQRICASNPRLARMYDSFRQNLTDIVRTGKQAGAQVLLMTVPVNLRDQPPFASEPGGADEHFRRGQDLLEHGRTEPAAVEFRLARDLDLLRFRADSTVNEIIRATAKQEGAQLVDAEQQFGIAGDDLFWEHVHFNPLGTYRIATQIAQALGVTSIPSFGQLRQTLPVT